MLAEHVAEPGDGFLTGDQGGRHAFPYAVMRGLDPRIPLKWDPRVKPEGDNIRFLQPQLAEARMVVRATPLVLIRARPVELTVRIIDADIVAAGLAAPPPALGVEFPLRVALARVQPHGKDVIE